MLRTKPKQTKEQPDEQDTTHNNIVGHERHSYLVQRIDTAGRVDRLGRRAKLRRTTSNFGIGIDAQLIIVGVCFHRIESDNGAIKTLAFRGALTTVII